MRVDILDMRKLARKFEEKVGKEKYAEMLHSIINENSSEDDQICENQMKDLLCLDVFKNNPTEQNPNEAVVAEIQALVAEKSNKLPNSKFKAAAKENMTNRNIPIRIVCRKDAISSKPCSKGSRLAAAKRSASCFESRK